MLQNNALSGLLFLVGIFCNSWIMGIGALIGVIISTTTAVLFHYAKEDIESGLYGFNGALIGIAACFFFEFSITVFLLIIIGAALSSILVRLINKMMPSYTSPFVLVTWVLIFSIKSLTHFTMLVSPLPENTVLDLFSAVSMGFGQVMFQANIITGLIFFLALLINSRIAAVYAVYGSLLGVLFAMILSLPLTMINIGLFGYNAILCAIALGDKKWISFLLVTTAIILSVLLNAGLAKINIISLTSPFIIATWVALLIKNQFVNKPV
jgi:urea transporter